jgi:hypothetical protein
MADNNSSAESQPSFSFAVLGDTQSFDAKNPNGSFQKAVRSIATDHKDISLAFSVGDLVSSCDGNNSCETKYNSWKSIMSPILSKTYEIQGNHDRTGKEKADAIWQKEFGSLPGNGPTGFSKLVYSFNFENSHFVVLDSEKPEEGIINSAQIDWLEKDLVSTKKENIFVFYHEPAFQTSIAAKHGLDAHSAERDALWNVITKYQVTAVFNGHDHIHTRKNIGGTYQIVVGNTDSDNVDHVDNSAAQYGYEGKGYMVVAVDEQKITLKLYAVDGNLVNSFDFGK